LTDLFEKLDPVHGGHIHIGDDDGEWSGVFEGIEGLLGADDGMDGVVLAEVPFVTGEDIGVVVDAEDVGFHSI
jgi:hypothetical protein